MSPIAAPRYCSSPGCAALVPHGRCPAHQTRHYRDEERRRGTATQRGYDADWRRVRDAVLAAEPLCRACLADGVTSAATEVDHIVPLAHGGDRLARANLQPLCDTCHSAKTAGEHSARRRA